MGGRGRIRHAARVPPPPLLFRSRVASWPGHRRDGKLEAFRRVTLVTLWSGCSTRDLVELGRVFELCTLRADDVLVAAPAATPSSPTVGRSAGAPAVTEAGSTPRRGGDT